MDAIATTTRRELAAYLRGARRCDTPAALGAYTVSHLRDVVEAEWSECAQTTRRGRLAVLSTTDPELTGELMRVRAATGEPPSPEAMVDETVTIIDLAASSPWPSFGAGATAATPVRSAVLTYFTTSEGAGVLTVIDRRPAHFDADRQSHVRFVADLFAVLLAQLETTAEVGRLQQAVLSGRLVGAACGMLAARRGISTDAAFALLVRGSQRSHRKVRDLAEHVLVRGDLR